ncbi:hypothetical protein AB6A40_006071 [Gnathostoma spinigerum]|uniref:Serine carboxypeptidase S28 n=1 Tax=Gnathostoma spinigerum TaxID=75299 RepID=A0ABD6EJH5_9BILA
MARATSAIVIILLIVVTSAHYGVRRMPAALFGRPFSGGFLNHNHMDAVDDPKNNVTESVVTQVLDHFSDFDKRTWNQRYFYNRAFINGSGLAFLMIGGESTLSKAWITNHDYQWMRWAKKYGAAVFEVEHRFYGGSHPLKNMSVESYRYFTVEQALADIRMFVDEMERIYGNEIGEKESKKVRWVVFGGSYPGSLAAWFRANNPDKTIGAVASSSAVNTVTDYYVVLDNIYSSRRNVLCVCPLTFQCVSFIRWCQKQHLHHVE